MSKEDVLPPSKKINNDLKNQLIREVLRAQKVVLLDPNKNNSSEVLSIVKRLIPRK
jgi:hypothetical protein